MKKVLFIFISFFLIIGVKAESALAPNAKSSIMIEASTGEIIYSNNEHEKLAPASMTKIMSLLLIMESIDNNIINLDDKITISENASSMGGSQILLETGEEMIVDDLLKGITIASGNDAVVALAEAIAGTEENFVSMMNAKVKELGLKDTNFKNCHGLDTEGHYSSAYDMAMISKELVKHQKILDYSSIYETYLRENTDKKIWLVNTNKLVRFKKGVDGLKTGYTETAGYCLTATMKKDNMRIIATVMGESDSKTRNSEVSSMLDYAFAQYELKTLLTKNKVLRKINLSSANDSIEVVPKTDVNVLIKKSNKNNSYTYKSKINDIKLPVKKGDNVGYIKVLENGKEINRINLTVKNSIDKSNLIELYLKNIRNILSGDINF